MGPQIVVSAVFDELTAVTFNTYRTYLRVLAAVVTVLTASSWPLQSSMFAERRVDELKTFLSWLMRRSLVLATTLGLVQVIVSGPVFEFLFRSKIPVDRFNMIVMLASVIVNCGISVQQSVFMATNLSSQKLVTSLMLIFLGLIAMAVFGKMFGIVPALFAQLLADGLIFYAVTQGVHAAFHIMRTQSRS
jgi:O-antigen/teichoic acid export membrane protein